MLFEFVSHGEIAIVLAQSLQENFKSLKSAILFLTYFYIFESLRSSELVEFPEIFG